MSEKTLLTMPGFSICHDIVIKIIVIIIATNVIVLEFLSAQSIHPGALLPYYLFLTRVRT